MHRLRGLTNRRIAGGSAGPDIRPTLRASHPDKEILMGLFSRRRSGDASESSAISEGAASEPVEAGTGPWDAARAPERPGAVGRIDLGSLHVPAVDGMQIRLESPGGAGQEISAAVLVLAGSTLELRAFAAPRTTGIWDELREDIVAELDRAGARFEVEEGEHGPEILAHVPVRTPDGRDGTVAARFIGVDGPRWFLRGVLQGPAATDEASSPTSSSCATAPPGRRGRFSRCTRPGSAPLPPPRTCLASSPSSPGRPLPRCDEPCASRPEGPVLRTALQS